MIVRKDKIHQKREFTNVRHLIEWAGEANGQRPREVLITPDEWREKLARATLD